MLGAAAILFSQEQLSVAAFNPLPNDMTARTLAPERDANGSLTALIKVVTAESGFEFEGGSLGIAKVEPKTAEIWVYVPAGARTITIKHPQLGILRNYAYPVAIEAGNVYEMKLTHGELEVKVKERQIVTEFVIITSEPSGADVYLNNEPAGKTPFQAEKPEGRYEWRVVRDLYLAEAGVFELKSGEKQKLSLQLKPNYGTLEVVSVPEAGATIAVNGFKTGKSTPATLEEVPSGEQTLTLTHAWYETTTQKVTVVAGKSEQVRITMQPNFAELTAVAKADEEVYLNDSFKGKGTLTERLAPGVYRVEVRKAGHTPATKQLTLSRGDKETLSLTPVPILSALKVLSEPMEAEIYLNGKLVGTTPQIVRDLLVGDYALELRKEGFGNAKQSVTVKAGETVEVAEVLTKGGGFEPELVFVEGGTFTMGCTSEQGVDCYESEKPSHQVTVSSFQMGKYEVTQAQWRAVMGNNPSSFSGCDDCPVENVSWNDAQAYISKLNQQTGKSYRLPTEAEWEFAARGGKQSKGYKYSGSNTLGSVAWYADNSSSQTHAEGQKQANELGIYDMSGNVWEWCEDWYGGYSSSSQTNPKGPQNRSFRVLRGGSWNYVAKDCRVSDRRYYYPVYRNSSGGFRLVLP